MATAILSQQEYYQKFLDILQGDAPELTDDNVGSIVDSLCGLFSVGAIEIQKRIVDEFLKTFFSSANGPEVTGGQDDLEALAVDHFGDTFARPEATPAVGIVNFTRPTSGFGDCLIPAGTIVKTRANANGVAQRYATLIDATMATTSINASVQAVVEGEDGNADIGEVTIIESTLLDSTIVVTNGTAFDGGEPVQDDATYRETIRDLLLANKSSTKEAIEAKARTVAGVETATAIETSKVVKEWDIAADDVVGSMFRIPYCTLYIADANGTASQALIDLVKTAIRATRAAGVRIGVAAATAVTVNWSVNLTFDPDGPNFDDLQDDASPITDEMTNYINALPVGTGFVREDAEDAIMAIWGPTGTGDLSAFTTTSPVGDVSASATQKMVAGTVAVT